MNTLNNLLNVLVIGAVGTSAWLALSEIKADTEPQVIFACIVLAVAAAFTVRELVRFNSYHV